MIWRRSWNGEACLTSFLGALRQPRRNAADTLLADHVLGPIASSQRPLVTFVIAYAASCSLANRTEERDTTFNMR